MKTCLELTPDELAGLVAAVAEYNGYRATGLLLYKGNDLVEYDRAVIQADGATLEVRVKKTDAFESLREFRKNYAAAILEEIPQGEADVVEAIEPA